MRFGTRIFIFYMVIFAVCFFYPVKWMSDNLRTHYLEGVEDPLADQANIMAAIAGAQMEARNFNPAELFRIFENAYSRHLSARIYDFMKTGIDMKVYITDNAGKIIFDSEDMSRVGQDYSQKRDVQLTLRGKYGARTSKSDPNNPASSVLYVAAPVFVDGKIAGVLTVVKPTTTINTLLERAKPQLMKTVGVSATAALLLSFLVSIWMTRSIRRLTRYANDVREGEKAPFPELSGDEIGEMGKAFEKMREALEGRKYVEGYVQTLTHEVKSPLSAIRGAAELLGEDMESGQRTRFLTNIRNEANRIQEIVDRMLELSALENLKGLEKKERLSFSSLVETVIESKHALLSKKILDIRGLIPQEMTMQGDPFLLSQALSNIIQNAIDFSPEGGHIELTCEMEDSRFRFTVRDHGPGIPDYAKDKIFDKFYSLQRPDTGKKSTGLGLNFVRAVAELHKGKITLENCPEGGVRAVLTLPRN